MCTSLSQITSSPGSVKTFKQIWFAIVPLGTKSDASLPRSSAVYSSNLLTVGSSLKTSSPTSASCGARVQAGPRNPSSSNRPSDGASPQPDETWAPILAWTSRSRSRRETRCGSVHLPNLTQISKSSLLKASSGARAADARGRRSALAPAGASNP